MRLGLVVRQGRESEMARLAEAHGLFGILSGADEPSTSITAACYAATATDFVRIVVLLRLGTDHPVTLAEELSVLDNVSNGRTVVLADTADLEPAAAEEEVTVLREALASRPLQHSGPRWRAPAGLPANSTAPKAIMVTPKPAQLEVPFWLTGAVADAVSRSSGLPMVARRHDEVARERLVQPAMDAISGDLESDRARVVGWAEAGATHLLIHAPEESGLTLISRWLAPEVGMPEFPRIMSDSSVPMAWPPH